VGWSPRSISKHERGERRFDVVEVLEITAALRVDACDLVAEAQRTAI
jgi:hypothetical protein